MPSLKSAILAVAFGVAATAASAQTIDVPAGTYAIDATHSNVLWSVSHSGLSNYIGRFNKVAATLELDPADVTKSKLTATIDPRSVDTSYPHEETGENFDAEIAGESFFDAAKFSEITFKSTSIAIKDGRTGTLTGDLTFHGVTRPVTLDVTLNAALNPHPMSKKPTIGFSATGTIKRSDFGVNFLVGPIGDDVKLTIEIEFVSATA